MSFILLQILPEISLFTPCTSSGPGNHLAGQQPVLPSAMLLLSRISSFVLDHRIFRDDFCYVFIACPT